MQGASTVFSYDATRRQANTQADYEKAAASANDAALSYRQVQINEQATQQMSQRAIEAMRERGRLEAALGSGIGAGGTSGQRMVNESDFNAGQDMATIEANRVANWEQTQSERGTVARRANAELAAIRQPSLIGAGLQIAGAALDSGATYYNAKQKIPSNKAG